MSKLQITPGTNIRWERSYGIGREDHWCLVSDESDKDGKCINPYTVLFASCAEDMAGKPLDEQPDLVLYADAHNTHNALPVLPSELKRRLEVITTEIQGADVSIQRTHDQDPTRFAVVDLNDWNRILALLNLTP